MRYSIVFCVFSLFFFISLSAAVAQETSGAQNIYKIGDISFDITGSTKEYPLSQALDIEMGKTFFSLNELEQYIADKQQVLKNQRVLETGEIVPSFSAPDDSGVITVNLNIIAVDTWNLIILPYPKFDSNDGFELKLKLKHYNFLGSMQTLNADVLYQFTDENKHVIGGNLDFSIPFKLGMSNSSWNIETGIKWPVGERPDFSFGTGLSFSVPFSFFSINTGLKQQIHYNPDYPGDEWYFTEEASFAMPFRIASIPNNGDVMWTPSASFIWHWDPDGVKHSDLVGPTFTFGHSLSAGRTDWTGNFRDGLSGSFSQTVKYNIHTYAWEPYFTTTVKGFVSTKHVGFNGRMHTLYYLNATTDTVGENIRGIRDSKIVSDAAVIFNLEMPIKLFTTDWVKWFGVNWMELFNFEMQISPFLDIAFAHVPGTVYSVKNIIKDGYYAGGIEILVFPTHARSLVGRISVGTDLGSFLPASIYNKPIYYPTLLSRVELFIGLGLFL